MRRSFCLWTTFALLAGGPPVAADDLSGADALLCTAVEVTRCLPGGDCLSLPPWELNVPQFIEIDLEALTLATTRASGQNRSTPIRTLERENGSIFLQGIEGGRAFSFVIDEGSGLASIAIARDSMAVTVFGACTPLSAASSTGGGGEE